MHAEDQHLSPADQQDPLQQLDAADSRKVEVQDHDVEGLAAKRGQRLAPIGDLAQLHGEGGGQQPLQAVAHDRVVIDQQDLHAAFRPRPRLRRVMGSRALTVQPPAS